MGPLLPECLMSVCVLTLLLLRRLPPRLALIPKRSSPLSLLVNASGGGGWGFDVLEILRDPYLETLHLTFFVMSPISVVISFIDSGVDPVKSCAASGPFSPAGIARFGLDG